MASRRTKEKALLRHVNLTWLARALEDGRSPAQALLEVYGGSPAQPFAADLRALLDDKKDG